MSLAWMLQFVPGHSVGGAREYEPFSLLPQGLAEAPKSSLPFFTAGIFLRIDCPHQSFSPLVFLVDDELDPNAARKGEMSLIFSVRRG